MNKSLILRLVLGLALLPSISMAQSFGKLSGTVENEKGERVSFASIHFNKSEYSLNADIDGEFVIQQLPAGNYTMTITAVGYKAHEVEIAIKSGETVRRKVVLEEKVTGMGEIYVQAKSEAREVAEQAYQTTIVDAQKLHNTTQNIADGLSTIPGVRIRESGGVGSNADFSLNGFSGNQVKFFIDGIPMQNRGNAFRINNIPINIAERIEVYKGVVPVTLGSDALGGAVNIVTNSGTTDYLDASYSYGSFDTHKASVNTAVNTKDGFIFTLNAFLNASQNNYWVEAETPVNEYGQIEKVRTRRFHDQYQNGMLRVGAGVRDKSWADRLIVGMDIGGYDKDLQNGATMEDVYGKRKSKGVTILPSVKYLKKDLLTEGLDLNLTGNFNFGYDRTTDTVNVEYNWLGEIIREFPGKGGERGRMDTRYRDNDGVFTGNLSYEINEKHALVLNNNFTTFKRVRNDLLDEQDEYFNRPDYLQKNVLGLSYRYDYSDRWNTSVFAKYYTQHSRSFVNVTATDNPRHEDYDWRENTFSTFGYGLATTYFIRSNLQVRVSYEHGIRVPTGGELFGNMNTLTGNISLDPESSENVNLGVTYNPSINNTHFITLDGAILYRYSKDFIRPSLERGMSATIQQMVNLRDVDNRGVEGTIRYQYKNKINLGANLSYQNLINRTKYEGGQGDIVSIVYKDRIPNMPYLFGNADASYSLISPFGMDGILTIGYQLLYVHEFYEGWPSLGDRSTKITIPAQWKHDASLKYSSKEGRYNLTFEVQNFTDDLLYDHFKLQKPSRSFNVKLRYFFLRDK